MNLIDAWILAWGTLYVFNAILKPNAMIKPHSPKVIQSLLNLILGSVIILSLRLESTYLYAALGLLMSSGCIASYYGMVRWNVPTEHSPSAQTLMAVLDLIASVMFFSKVLF